MLRSHLDLWSFGLTRRCSLDLDSASGFASGSASGSANGSASGSASSPGSVSDSGYSSSHGSAIGVDVIIVQNSSAMIVQFCFLSQALKSDSWQRTLHFLPVTSAPLHELVLKI
jgi:hypothetical protein